MTTTIRDYDPALGMAFQGDVAIVPIPKDIPLDLRNEIPPTDHKLILQEGELTGHHHAIELNPLPRHRQPHGRRHRAQHPPSIRPPLPNTTQRALHYAGPRHYHPLKLLLIKVGPMCLLHPEHDGIRIPPGAYLIGRQVEATATDERLVED